MPLDEDPVQLDQLVQSVTAMHPGGEPLDRVADATAVAERLGALGDHLVGHFVDQARLAGVSWREIGESLGVSKQAVQKRFVPGPTQSRASDRRIYRRFAARARSVIHEAEDAAGDAGSAEVFAEHLVLALLRDPEAVATEALATMTGSLSRVRAALERAPRRAPAREHDGVTLSVEVRGIVDRAANEALRLGHDQVGTEHLLWAVMAEGDSFAAGALRRVEVSVAEASQWLAIGAGRRGEHPRPRSDGDAVAACRALLEREGLPRPETWRSTVVTKDGPQWVVRIWTGMPAHVPRPVGVPDRVYVVTPDPESATGLRIQQVHPQL